MHEWGIVEETIKEIIRQTKANSMKNVERVLLSFGEDGHLTEDAVRFCFASLAKGTILENTKIKIKKTKETGITIESIEGSN
jgi:Zn finger protein HypA/HybF involved in hydrogenase expression